jgi:long-chain acyl-CoA synthetase
MAENYLNILADTIRNNWDAPALTDFYLTEDGTAQDTSRGNRYTYGEMYAELCRVAELLTSLGLQKGDHIAICGANSAHWVIAYLAIAKMQGVSVTVMHTLMPDEKARLVNFSDAKALFADEEIWRELPPSFQGKDGDRLSSVISLADWSILRGEKIQISNLQSSISKQDCTFPQSAPDDLATICFTSGSTGISKGVMFSNRNISCSCACVYQTFPVKNNRIVCSILPLSHIFGLVYLPFALYGGCNIFFPIEVRTPLDIITIVYKSKPYAISIVPQLAQLLMSDKFKDLDFSYIENFVVGGAGLSESLLNNLISRHIHVTVGYGSTETCGSISMINPKLFKKNSVGKIPPAIEINFSSNGEILVKGENVMLGYYKDPEATAAKIDADGWLHTGDKGHLDEDGYLYVEGRLEQDIIVLPNGENIRPDNIESLINALPEVSESIVLARDGHLVAIVVPATPSSVSSVSSASSSSSSLRRKILRTVNPSLPLFSQLYDVEITDQPLARTEKQTLKRYLYS